ncbi:MAG: hypothetical protein M1818_007098 [Claussenomyces sp. TS43310]|nr:MAG: hypothetical protein M1818_007098 [Claussenomyces sp. TS43310]
MAAQKRPVEPPEDLISQALEPFSPPAEGNHGATPSLPPAMAAMHDKTGDEILKDLNKAPLFMTDLEENDELEAFKALAYEGTPSEVALNFKEQGNECFKAKKWADAKEFFTKGIQVLQGEQRKRASATVKEGETPVSADEQEIREELAILEASLSNRAACHLKLKNHRSCTLDCALVLRLNPRNLKAYYRSSSALLALQRVAEANDACARGLELDPENVDLRNIADQIVKKHAEIQARRERALQAEQKKRREELLLKTALKARGIRTRRTAQPPEMEDARVQLVPDPGDPQSSLIFPTVLLYPLYLQSDFVKNFSELETLGSRLQHVLAEPIPWDRAQEYTYKNVECYMETLTGGLIKVGKSVTLLKVLGAGNVEVVDDVVRIFVVPKAKAGMWIQDFKRKKAAEKGSG